MSGPETDRQTDDKLPKYDFLFVERVLEIKETAVVCMLGAAVVYFITSLFHERTVHTVINELNSHNITQF